MKLQIYLILLVLFSISCKSKENDRPVILKQNNANKKEKLVLISKNKTNKKTNIGSGINIQNFNRIDLDLDKSIDTVRLKSSKYQKLYIRNDNYFKVILCYNTDTIYINVDENQSKVSFKTRKLKKYDTLSLDNIYKQNSKKLIISHNKLFKKFMNRDKFSNKITANENIIKSDVEGFRKLDISLEKKLKRKKEIIKKLEKENLISIVNAKYEISQLEFKYFTALVNSYNLSNDSYFLEKIKDNFFNNNKAFKDSFISYGYLNLFLTKVILNKEKAIFPNYGKAYKLLDDFFKNDVLRLFKEFCLHQMGQQNQATTTLLKFYDLYKKKYIENDFTKLFESKYLVKEKITVTPKSVSVIDTDLKATTLEEIVKKHNGSLIYVDFWASWCGPCLAEMPNSKKIQKEFENKKIVFIYISIDTDKNKWLKSYKKQNINNNNYLALNYPNANFYSETELKTIPRYMIFDTKGKIIDENAPRPSEKRLKDIFTEFTKNKIPKIFSREE